MSARAKQIIVIGLSWFLALAFLFAGGSKLAASEMQVEGFAEWGFPLWFMYLTGALEVLAAVLIFV
ncbi:MAG: DoxX family protein, partial [Phycisphaeraceae bacterium]